MTLNGLIDFLFRNRYERILEKEGRKAKLVLVPDFSATGEVICVDVNSNELRTELLSFEL